MSAESLQVDMEIWKEMFDVVINPCIEHIDKLLQETEKMKDCKYLCLVGGLSTSIYFRSKMRLKFGEKSEYKLKLIIPNRPMLSVVTGAAYFGITKNYIKARVLRYSYGQIGRYDEQTARKMKIPLDHIANNMKYDKHDGKWRVNNCFGVIARKSEEIYNGKVKISRAYRTKPTQMKAITAIMISDMEYPKIKSDGEEMGTITTEFDNENLENMQITLEFHFAETLIKVVTYQTAAPQKKQTRFITNYK